MFREFRDFLTKTNALALAIGVIIGGAVGKVVSSLVADVLMPVIGLGIPGGSWREAKIPLRMNPDGTVAAAITIGNFLGTIVDFLIIGFCVFMVTKMLLKPEPAPAATKVCPECRETIPVEARKCRACTSPV
jgi:large conductance mechanosensitive channel